MNTNSKTESASASSTSKCHHCGGTVEHRAYCAESLRLIANEKLVGKEYKYISPSWEGNVEAPNRITVGMIAEVFTSASFDVYQRSEGNDLLQRGGPSRWGVARLETGELIPLEGAHW